MTVDDNQNHSDEANEARGRPYKPGESGNPAGRPRGSKNRSTVLLQALIDDSVEALLAKANELALGGNTAMLQMFLKSLLRREQPITFELPELRTAGDAANAMKRLLREVANGQITLSEAERVGALLDTYLKALEADDFDKRIRDLEEQRRRR
jgi:hypothetical protein